MAKIPLKVLIVDKDDSSANMLSQALDGMSKIVISTATTKSLVEAASMLEDKGINAIYIDPISVDLDEASTFILKTRTRLPSIVFVLYIDFDQAERIRAEFYFGERRRFGHYFKLNKLTPIATFQEEVRSTIHQCQADLQYTLTSDKLTELQKELVTIQKETSADTATVPLDILIDIQKQIRLSKRTTTREVHHHCKTEIGFSIVSFR